MEVILFQEDGPGEGKNFLFLTKENSNNFPITLTQFSNNYKQNLLNKNTLSKEERLKSKKLIDLLFEKGNAIQLFPFKLLWIPTSLNNPVPANIGFAVSSRNFPKAVDRNKIKRLLREVYRLNKQLIYKHLSKQTSQYAFMLIYTSKKILSFEEVNIKIIQILNRFIEINETFDKDS